MSNLLKDDPTPLDFEVGPIRPPSEARSLLVRVSRNCPWNKCTFCPVYKKRKFSRRPVEDVEADIEAMGRVRDRLLGVAAEISQPGAMTQQVIHRVMNEAPLHAGIGQVALFLASGGKTVFLQDANSLLLKPPDLARVVRKIKQVFPDVERITSYARSQTLARTPVEGLTELLEAGLNRIHVGLETGSDTLLLRVRKGCTKDQHIRGGRNVIDAGIQLSEYVMPGLGGADLWEEHADETADALNQIDPHFIRLRSLGLRSGTGLREEFDAAGFDPLDDDGVVREIRRFIRGLEGVRSRVVSDHILNLLEEVEGELPGDKQRILDVLDGYLGLPDEDRLMFQLGRRMGALRSVQELDAPRIRQQLAPVVEQALAHPDGPTALIRELITRFI
jgi:Radical SAM superfamily